MKKQIKTINFSGMEKVILTVKRQNVIVNSDAARIYDTETEKIKQEKNC